MSFKKVTTLTLFQLEGKTVSESASVDSKKAEQKAEKAARRAAKAEAKAEDAARKAEEMGAEIKRDQETPESES